MNNRRIYRSGVESPRGSDMGTRSEGAVGVIIRPTFAHKVHMTTISPHHQFYLNLNMDQWYSLMPSYLSRQSIYCGDGIQHETCDNSNEHVTSPDSMYLLCILNLRSNVRCCDIIFSKGQIFFEGLPFLQFCRK